MNRIPEGAWVVVADGRHARMLENVGEGGELQLRQQEVVEGQNLDDEGPAGVQPQEIDVDEATFAKQLAQRINLAALRQQFEHIVLVADPKTLGQMRPLLHDEVAQRLVAEVPKTLTNAPLEDIQRLLH